MQGLEAVLFHPLFALVCSGCLFLAQLYFVSKIDPIKKSVDRVDSDNKKQWDAIGAIEKQLNILQGQHDAMCGKRKR